MNQFSTNGSRHASARLDVPRLVLMKAEGSLLQSICGLARSYPHPHSVLGRRESDAYVQKMAAQTRQPGEGWYAVLLFDEVVGAAHLGVYGVGDGRGHTLWKIRHPMTAAGAPPDCLTFLFNGLLAVAAGLRAGTNKFVIFLGAHEQDVMLQAHDAGFEQEACFKDYYRLGEPCYVYGRTSA